jgi:hypothetical protein
MRGLHEIFVLLSKNYKLYLILGIEFGMNKLLLQAEWSWV